MCVCMLPSVRVELSTASSHGGCYDVLGWVLRCIRVCVIMAYMLRCMYVIKVYICVLVATPYPRYVLSYPRLPMLPAGSPPPPSPPPHDPSCGTDVV